MALKEALRQATLRELESLDLLSLPFYSRGNSQILAFLHEHEVLDDASIERALEPAVIAQAKKDYDLVVHKKEYPDHVGRPECLAYAIQQRVFSPRQVRKIQFDHGETPETFCQHYGIENLLANLRQELLNPKPLPKFEGDYDEHPACCSH
jgi:hypothetical protein